MTSDFHPDPHELDEHHDLFDYEHDGSSGADQLTGTDPQLFDDGSSNDPTATIDTGKQSLPEPESYEYEDPNDARRTISMTVFFLVFMVLYIGFCCYYRKVKLRHTVGDSDEEALTRQQRRSENRAVMDESITASTRARQNEEEAKKLAARKENIKKALLSRLIVDEGEDKEVKNKTSGDTGKGCGGNKNCSCEQCQYWQWESVDEGNMQKRHRGGVVQDAELSAATNAAADAIAAASHQRGRIITNQEDSDEEEGNEDEPNGAEDAGSAKAQDEKIDLEAQTLDKHEKAASSNLAASPMQTPSSSPRSSPRALQPVSSPASPSRLSLSSPREYMDALNCGNSSVRLNCSNHTITCNNAARHKSNLTDSDNNNGTISLLAIIGTYGEECNICLSHFQVGDRAAWSKYQGIVMDDSTTVAVGSAQDEKEISDCQQHDSDHSNVHGCRHIFHEECISRWLLVRDGCPICRRTYFPEVDEDQDAVPDVDEQRDLEIGMVG